MNNINIYPTILTDSRELFVQQLALIQSNSSAKVVQVDVIDGEFVDNLTLFPSDMLEFNFGDLQIDFHLQTQEPIDVVQEIIDFRAGLPVRSIIGQVERMSSQEFFVEEVKKQGWRVGLSLDLYTEIDSIEPESWELLDIVQVMGNYAGFQGKELHPHSLETLAKLKQLITKNDRTVELNIDVGVRQENLADLVEAGATGICVGSVLWNSADFNTTYQQLLNLANQFATRA